MDCGPFKAKHFCREMSNTRECYRCHETGHTAAMCQMGSPDKVPGGDVEPQTDILTREVAEE